MVKFTKAQRENIWKYIAIWEKGGEEGGLFQSTPLLPARAWRLIS